MALLVVAIVAGTCGGSAATSAPASSAATSAPASSAVGSAIAPASAQTSASSGPHAGGTLRVCIGGGILNSDPGPSQYQKSWQILESVHEGLVRLDTETGLPVGVIAKSWDIAADGLTYTLHLRPGVKFHNGRTLVAADVKFCLKRIKDPATKSALMSDMAPVTSIDAPDPATVVLHLQTSHGPLPRPTA